MSTVAATVRDRIRRARPGTFFRSTDFEGTRPAVESFLSRLTAQEKVLLRVRRGLYWKGVASRYGSGRPGVDAIVRAVTEGCGAGPAGWSASHALGLSTQMPATPTYAVVGPPPSGIPGTAFRSRRNLGRVGLGYHEIALLEVLREWPRFIEADWTTLVARVAELRGEGRIRPESVRRAAERERMPALRDRVAALVTALAARSPDPAPRRA